MRHIFPAGNSILLVLVLACIAFSGANAQTASKPNVLFIILDDMNDYTGFMNGHPNAYTPHMDELARRGIVFENAYCNSPKCVPSRVSFLSGRDPDYTNVYRNSVPFKKKFRGMFKSSLGTPDIFTLPEMFKDSGGYYTAGFDKVFHGSIYQNYSNDFDTASVPACDKELSWNEFTDFRDISSVPIIKQDGFTRMKFGKIADSLESQMEDYRTATAVKEFIDDWAANPGDYCDRPFFIGMGIYRPHNPYEVPERYFPENYNRDFNVFPYESPCNTPNNLYPPNGHVQVGQPLVPDTEYDQLPNIGRLNALSDDSINFKFDEFAQGLSTLPPIAPGYDSTQRFETINNSMRCLGEMAYLASIRYADEQIGRVIETLDDYPEVRDNTIIVVTSDHGYSWRNHGHYHKGALWDTDIRIPLVIVDPRRTGGQRTTGVASLLDVYPTLLELAQITEPVKGDGSRYLDGQSLVPFMDNPGFSRDFPAHSTIQLQSAVRDARCFPHSSIRNDEWHYIRYRTNGDPTGCNAGNSTIEEELYHVGRNREIDPEELNNLANDPDHQIIKDYLAQWLPDSSMFYKVNYSVDIDVAGLNCNPAPSDPLTFTADLKDANGAAYDTSGTGIIYQWQIDPAGLTNSGPVLNTTVGSLGATYGDGSVRIRLKTTLPDGTFHLEQISLQTAPTLPGIGFTVVQNDREIEVIPNDANSAIYTSDWSFGDGFTYSNSDGAVGAANGNEPPAHAYSNPGTYTITQTANYGDGCSATSSQTVTITAAQLAGLCPTPGIKRVLDISSNQAELAWSPVYNATEYLVRARRTAFGVDDNYIERNTSDTSLFVKNMPDDTEFEMQVAAVCGTDTSEWDFPLRIITEPCYPPRQFETLTADTNSVKLRWLPGEGDQNKQAFRFKAAGSSLIINTVGYDDQKTFSGLNPGTTYEIRALTICNQLDGSVGKGKPSYRYYATTNTLRSQQEIVSEITVFPNPASEFLQIQLNAATLEPATVKLVVTDAEGKEIESREMELTTGMSSMQIDISDYAVGVYNLRTEANELIKSATFVKMK